MLPYNYKLKVSAGLTQLWLNGRNLGFVSEVELSDKYITFKDSKGVVVRQHLRRPKWLSVQIGI